MSTFYIRSKPKWINFIHADIEGFIEMYEMNPQPLVIGDLSLMSPSKITKLLKLVEDYPLISCYSSSDLDNPVLYSRFSDFKIGPLPIREPEPESYKYVDLINDEPEAALIISRKDSFLIRSLLR